MLTVALNTESIYGGSDSINHYFIAREAFQQPSLFLDPWGRPAYTILSAPFALLGYEGSILFNVLLGLATVWMAYGIARRLYPESSWLAMMMVAFTPIFMVMLYTALTEILFAFLLVLGVWLFLAKRYITAAIVCSFLPFARTEGFILLPLLIFAFLYTRQFRSLPLLATGIIVFSIAGIPVFKDPFWVFTRFPYPVGQQHEVYTWSGSLFHFLLLAPEIFGWPVTIFAGAGILLLGWKFFTAGQTERRDIVLQWLLIILPFVTYFLLHSFLYWRSMGGSVGLLRVMAAVAPLAALAAMPAWDLINRHLLPHFWMKTAGFLIVSAWIIHTCLSLYPLPTPPDPEEKTLQRAVKWIRNNHPDERRLFYTDLKVPYYLGTTRYDTSCRCYWYFGLNGLQVIRRGDLLIWDSHFGPNENAVPFDTIMTHPEFRLLGYFKPSLPWKTLNNEPYEVYIFERTSPGYMADNEYLLDSLKKSNILGYRQKPIRVINFEAALPGVRMDFVNSLRANSGKKSFLMNEHIEYSPGIFKRVDYITDQTDHLYVKASVSVFSESGFADIHAALVISLMDGEKLINYDAVYFDDPPLPGGQWKEVHLSLWLDKIRSGDYNLGVYVWNPARMKFFIDDLSATMFIPGSNE